MNLTEQNFNRTLGFGIFAVAIFGWAFGVGVNRFGYNRELPLLGTLIYYNFALLVSIISGLISGNKEVLTERRMKRQENGKSKNSSSNRRKIKG